MVFKIPDTVWVFICLRSCPAEHYGEPRGVKEVMPTQWSTQSLEWFADKLNPKIRGWINYYTRFNKDEAHGVFYHLNGLIRKWMKNTYKIRGKDKLYKKYQLIQAESPLLFYHWKLGIKA